MNVSARAMSGAAGGIPAHISIRNNRFGVVEADGSSEDVDDARLDVVVVDAAPHNSRLYYAEAFDASAQDRTPPDCWSQDGTVPDVSIPEPQSESCVKCPKAQWGSAPGSRGQACRQYRLLAVILPDGSGPYRFAVPPASQKRFFSYVSGLNKRLVGGRPIDLSQVVTRVCFDREMLGVLNFTTVGYNKVDLRKFYENGTSSVCIGYPSISPADTPPLISADASIPVASASIEPAKQSVVGSLPPPKPKRHRRTKAEMELAKKITPSGEELRRDLFDLRFDDEND